MGCDLHIKCVATTFQAAFMWRRPLNSVSLTTATHRGPEEVSDGTCTQMVVRMINKWKAKITRSDLYNVGDPP